MLPDPTHRDAPTICQLARIQDLKAQVICQHSATTPILSFMKCKSFNFKFAHSLKRPNASIQLNLLQNNWNCVPITVECLRARAIALFKDNEIQEQRDFKEIAGLNVLRQFSISGNTIPLNF
jgi:hypothetical protein